MEGLIEALACDLTTCTSAVLSTEVLTELSFELMSESVVPVGGSTCAESVTDVAEGAAKRPVMVIVTTPRCGNAPAEPSTVLFDTLSAGPHEAPMMAAQLAATFVAPTGTELVNAAPSASFRLLLLIVTV